jgi:polar amino acid transport system substrate-binding protein
VIKSRLVGLALLTASLIALPSLSQAADVPAPGTSARIDAIKAAGKLRIGVLTNPPWLIENTTGSGEPWDGPAWVLAKKAASELGVKLDLVAVSHETKVPALAANQIDIAVTPLAVSEERKAVIDFVTYSTSSVCMYGLASNKKFANAHTVDDLNAADVTVAYLIGAPEEAWTKERFPKAKLKGVISSSPTPIEEIMAGRSDAAAINRIQWPRLSKTVKGLAALPKENNCQDSQEKAAAIGYGIDKKQDAFRNWLQALADEMAPELKQVEQKVIADRL